MAIKWTEQAEGFYTCKAGILYGAVQFNGEDSYNWWVGTMNPNEDKSDEYALEQGNSETEANARAACLQELRDIAEETYQRSRGWGLARHTEHIRVGRRISRSTG
jgi:hypothetical protein